jgi:nuclear GTP-binding protein
MKVGKPKSKRVPVRLRHKIEKAASAKQKKQRKEAKKNPQWRSRLKKDPGIPNLFPYKARILAEVEENKRKKEEETQRRREVAKAQRQGASTTAADANGEENDVEDDEDILLDHGSDEDEDVMDAQDESNPMAALLASAQARAQAYQQYDDEDEEDEEDADEEWSGIDDSNTNTVPSQSSSKALPKQALADPIKAVSALLDRMQQTTDGIQRLIDHYQTPPLMSATTDLTSSFLVEVARKRGRLGRGGVPNLHSAALTVLSDLNEERLELPSVGSTTQLTAIKANGKGQVQVVSQLAEPFRIEGLWGDDATDGGMAVTQEMVVEK